MNTRLYLRLVAITIYITLLLPFSSCSKNEPEAQDVLVGEWQVLYSGWSHRSIEPPSHTSWISELYNDDDGPVFKFYADGTCLFPSSSLHADEVEKQIWSRIDNKTIKIGDQIYKLASAGPGKIDIGYHIYHEEHYFEDSDPIEHAIIYEYYGEYTLKRIK